MAEKLNIPVLMLVFNRPEETKRVFEAVRKAKPSRLYVAADGPRANRPDDLRLSKETRAIFDKIDWPCDVMCLYREQNMGCGPAVSEAITWFFEQEEMGIILEDDCLPSLDFFKFSELMLNKYIEDERVMQVCGSNFQQGNFRGDASYYFSMFSYIWGWATWRRAWNKYRYDLSNVDSFDSIDWSRYTKHKGILRYWRQTLMLSKKEVLNTWDYQWAFCILANGGLSLVPNVNLITNIGIHGATHGSDGEVFWTVNQSTQTLGEIKHTADVVHDEAADVYFYEKALKPNNNLIQKVVKTLRYIRLRLS